MNQNEGVDLVVMGLDERHRRVASVARDWTVDFDGWGSHVLIANLGGIFQLHKEWMNVVLSRAAHAKMNGGLSPTQTIR
jgi:hypothetical protein